MASEASAAANAAIIGGVRRVEAPMAARRIIIGRASHRGNRRGLAAFLCAVLCACLVAFPAMGAINGSDDPAEFVTYTVQPGDTLWSYAARATPSGGDVNDSIDTLMRINHLDSVSLDVGQRLKVPVVRP